MYQWRTLSEPERAEVLTSRQRNGRPWHSPPHWAHDGPARFHLSATCYEHAPHIGQSPARMDAFSDELLSVCATPLTHVTAWCMLPNHYHLLLETPSLRALTAAIGRLHGRTSRTWNLEERTTGRSVFHRAADRLIRSEGHFWATLNYVHHNPVRHGYVARWTDWPWSSACDYLRSVGREEAVRIWKRHPLLEYGANWDDPDL